MKQFLRATYPLITFFAIVIAVFSLLQAKTKYDEIDRYKKNLSALNSEITQYKTKSSKDAVTIKSLQVTSKEIEENLFVANENLNELKEKYKEVKSTLTILQNTKIDTVKVPFKVIIPCEFERNDSIKTEYYSFSYFMNQEGFSLLDLELPNEINVVTGLRVEKKGWFKKEIIPSTDISNTNPYVKINKVISQQPVEIKDKSYMWAAPLGILVGFLIAK